MNHSDRDNNLLEFSIHHPKGWLRYKRDKLGITGSQLAAKMGVTKQRISALEKSEYSGAASLKTMRQAAEALGCEFVYALIPKGALVNQRREDAPHQLDPLECMKSTQCSEKISSLCGLFYISSLGLYGSAARAELNDDSDINLLAEFEGHAIHSIVEIERMEIQFGRLFGRRTRIVDQDILDDPACVDDIMSDLKIIHLS